MNRSVYNISVVFLVFITLNACRKTDNPNPPVKADSTNFFGQSDSTQIIKSITYHTSDSSVSQYFFYDTANRKIIVSLQPVSVVGGAYTDGQEFSYDGFGMLTHISGKFSIPNDSYFTSADYTYDDQHVLSGASTVIPGLNYDESYTKTAVSGGYILSNLYTVPSVNGFTDSSYTAGLFDDNGRQLAYYTVYNNTEPGDPKNTSANGDTYFYFSDSVIYDGVGNMRQQTYRFPPDLSKPDSLVTVVLYDYGVRDATGDQLSNLGSILFRGVANIPFSIIDFFAGQLTPFGEIGMQVYKNPSQATTMITYDSTGVYNTTLHFSTPATYDDQHRLISYHNFAHFSPYTPYDLYIAYYK